MKSLSVLEILIDDPKTFVISVVLELTELETCSSHLHPAPRHMKQDLEINFTTTSLETEDNYLISPCHRILSYVRSFGKSKKGKYDSLIQHFFSQYLLCTRKPFWHGSA